MRHGLGWLPDLPDFRDYDETHPKMSGFFNKKRMSSPTPIDDSYLISEEHFSPVEDQENISSCTAHAGIGLMEYYQKRTTGKFLNMSRLFLYKTTRNLMKQTGDEGAYLRSTMQALVLFGCPPENYWEYDVTKYDDEPPAFTYSFAKEFQTLNYIHLDKPPIQSSDLLYKVKLFLKFNLPMMFGFTVYRSSYPENLGEIPYPSSTDSVTGGHAVIAMGYDDNKTINHPDGSQTKGAIKIRNSWGTAWGENGYGWLPYKYIESGLTADWWTIIKNEWADLDVFS